MCLMYHRFGRRPKRQHSLSVYMFDKFFDCLNVNSFTQGKRSHKAFQNPYLKATDFHLKVCIGCTNTVTSLTSPFLFYCNGWNRSSFHIWMSGRRVWKIEKASLTLLRNKCY